MTDLSERYEAWVKAWCEKECPPGCLPLPAQERDIALFAEVMRALITAENLSKTALKVLDDVDAKIETIMIMGVEYGFQECEKGNNLEATRERYKEIQRQAKEKVGT